MKVTRLILITLMALGLQPAFAADGGLSSGELMNYVGYGFIIFTLILFIIVMLVLLRTFKVLTRLIIGPEALKEAETGKAARKEQQKAEKGTVMERLLELPPMSAEEKLLLEGEYDGIKELDNPIPGWFMYLFYVTIAFAVCYLLIYHVLGIGQLQYAEYKTEMAQAAKEKAAYLAKSADKVDENTVKLTTDPAVLADGKSIFVSRCSPCHGPNGQGVIGPNLTDDYWLHGNKINDVFKTIEYGVPAKGMPTWESQLSPRQIADVANYVKSLHGTNPPNPKAPQGVKMTDDASSGAPAKAPAKAASM